jgi:hypothetical protein
MLNIHGIHFSSNSDGPTVQKSKSRSKKKKKFPWGQFCQQILIVGQLTPWTSLPKIRHWAQGLYVRDYRIRGETRSFLVRSNFDSVLHIKRTVVGGSESEN